MGRYFDEHLIATFADKGEFAINKSAPRILHPLLEISADEFGAIDGDAHPKMKDLKTILTVADTRKQGGNVVSYFCTRDGRVIHLLAGPVDANCLRREAQWAVSTYNQQLAESGGDERSLRDAMRRAHQRFLRDERRTVASDFTGIFSGGAAVLQGHRFLAKQSMPLLKEIEQEVFEQLAHERYIANGEDSAASPAPSKVATPTVKTAEAIASQKLALAKNLLSANRAAAQRRLREIIDRFPKSKAAAEAREMLETQQ